MKKRPVGMVHLKTYFTMTEHFIILSGSSDKHSIIVNYNRTTGITIHSLIESRMWKEIGKAIRQLNLGIQ